jgi:tRNA U38,U39,U40 pseudouridine synthase TruA
MMPSARTAPIAVKPLACIVDEGDEEEVVVCVQSFMIDLVRKMCQFAGAVRRSGTISFTV